MPKSEGQQKAITIAKEKLRKINMPERLKFRGFNDYDKKVLSLKLFGNLVSFDTSKLELLMPDNKPCRNDDTILFFHYLLNDIPVKEDENYISFRELPGGQFYWGPFNSRTAVPLARRVGNDLELLKKNLERFDWEAMNFGDFSAKIHALGDISLVLVYHLGDEEFPSTIDVLFPYSVKHIYNAEDAAALASRICISLL